MFQKGFGQVATRTVLRQVKHATWWQWSPNWRVKISYECRSLLVTHFVKTHLVLTCSISVIDPKVVSVWIFFSIHTPKDDHDWINVPQMEMNALTPSKIRTPLSSFPFCFCCFKVLMDYLSKKTLLQLLVLEHVTCWCLFWEEDIRIYLSYTCPTL